MEYTRVSTASIDSRTLAVSEVSPLASLRQTNRRIRRQAIKNTEDQARESNNKDSSLEPSYLRARQAASCKSDPPLTAQFQSIYSLPQPIRSQDTASRITKVTGTVAASHISNRHRSYLPAGPFRSEDPSTSKRIASV